MIDVVNIFYCFFSLVIFCFVIFCWYVTWTCISWSQYRACECLSVLCIMLHHANFPPGLECERAGEGWCQDMQQGLSIVRGDKKTCVLLQSVSWFWQFFRQHMLVVKTSVHTRRNLIVLKATFYFVKWCCCLYHNR
jgi:hypothetical protein